MVLMIRLVRFVVWDLNGETYCGFVESSSGPVCFGIKNNSWLVRLID